MSKDISYDKAYAFAISIVRLCQRLNAQHKEYVLSKQLLRSGTSIAANLAEAHVAISSADMASKASIALKECRESRYWLSLLRDTDYLTAAEARALISAVEEITRIVFAAVKTLRSAERNELPTCRD